MFKRSTTQRNRPELRHVYSVWSHIHKSADAKNVNLIALVMMVCLIPFDFLLFKDAPKYSEMRLVDILLCALGVVLIDHLYGRSRQTEDDLDIDHIPQKTDKVLVAVLLCPALATTSIYLWYIVITLPADMWIVTLANFMVACFATSFVYKYWREQYLVNGLTVAASFVLGAYLPELRREFIMVAISHILACLAAAAARRRLTDELFQRYRMLISLMPKKIAVLVALSKDDTKLFHPRDRFMVCLCLDWRNYQDLIRRKGANYTGRLFEAFYGLMFDELDKAVPDGSFFADWVADELFVIFFNDQDHSDTVIKTALSFAQRLRTTIPDKVAQVSGGNILFDVGIASGNGILGLQGPAQRKKTTTTAETAGIAKRFEAEAKAQRRMANYTGTMPVICVDSRIHNHAVRHHLAPNSRMLQVTPHEKDIKNKACYMWLPAAMADEPAAPELELLPPQAS